MKKLFAILIFAGALLFPWRSFAAVLSVGPSATASDTVAISLDTQGQTVNAVEAHFSFDTDLFSIGSVSDANSVVELWVSGPTFSNTLGTLDLAGIIPGGENTSDGTVVTITLVPKETNIKTNFTFVSGQVLLNDGRGTPTVLSVVINPFALGAAGSVSPALSTQAPDAFAPEIGRDPNIFSGQYFLAFSTTDQGSGIDHYDVLEVPAGTKVSSSSSGWQTATSPYLLHDQTLSSDIYVRAVDTSGNFLIEKVPATHRSPKTSSVWFDVELALGGIVLLLIVIGVVRRIRKKI